jgi:hypothetical protein
MLCSPGPRSETGGAASRTLGNPALEEGPGSHKLSLVDEDLNGTSHGSQRKNRHA